MNPLRGDVRTTGIRLLVLVGSVGAAFYLVEFIGVRRTGVWAGGGVRLVVILAILGLMGTGLIAFAKLIGLPVFPEARSPGAGSDAIPGLRKRKSRWQSRALAGAGMVLLLAGWVAVALLWQAIQAGRPSHGLALAGGWVLMLAIAGAAGGVVYHATDSIRSRSRAGHIFANVLSILAYCATAALLLLAAALLLG